MSNVICPVATNGGRGLRLTLGWLLRRACGGSVAHQVIIFVENATMVMRELVYVEG